MTSKKKNIKNSELRLIEKRRHPRFLLSHEVFREVKTGKIFPVYDLSMNGMSLKIEDKNWKIGALISGILNLHVDSIELAPRLVDYYGDRAALKFEVLSTYSRSVLNRVLSPKRLGSSLKLIKEKLPVADYWFHGACNTDLLVRLDPSGDVSRVEIFFSNYYWGWHKHKDEVEASMKTGMCRSLGKEKREEIFLSDEPVQLETIDLNLDADPSPEKVNWARGIVESSVIEERLKNFILKKF